MKTKLLGVILAVAIVAALVAGCGSGAAKPVVKKIDHITISTNQAQDLFTTLSTTLDLPVAWPFSAYPGFSTGGIQAGNVNLETLGLGDPVPGEEGAASIYGIVFEPYSIDTIMAPLADRGTDPSDPQVQMREIGGQQVPYWTNVTLNALCTPNYIVYLCEYSDAAKAALEGNTATGPLGDLGVMGVSKLVIGSKDAEALREQWRQAFAPSSMNNDGLMNIGSGPASEIVSASADAIQSLVFEVKSLRAARDFLDAHGLLGDSSGNELRIIPSKVQGLDIRIIQK